MMSTVVRQRIKKLRAIVEQHSEDYYNGDGSLISDEEYDKLFSELVGLEHEYPEYSLLTSPTSTVGREVQGETVRHFTPMLSLDNAMSEEEFVRFYTRIHNTLRNNHVEFICEPKVDGVSLSLTYVNGRLKEGLTRGNGIEGMDVTTNASRIKGIPLFIKELMDVPHRVVRGEAYIPLSRFTLLNEMLGPTGQAFATARNAASGTLRHSDPTVVSTRGLHFFAYDLQGIAEPTQSQEQTLLLLSRYGFSTAPFLRKVSKLTEVNIAHYDLLAMREELDYAIDGMVVKVNSMKDRKALPAPTSRFPHWAIAYKFPPETARTTLEKVEFSVTGTGRLSPVAVFKPVNIGGSTITRATLHNVQQIERLGLRIGSDIGIQLRGEIIPKVVFASGGSKDIPYPDACPDCSSTLEQDSMRSDIFCRNVRCVGRTTSDLIRFTSPHGMDIKGLSTDGMTKILKVYPKLRPEDLFTLTRDELLAVWPRSHRKVDLLLKSIEKSRYCSLENAIFALNIFGIGRQAARVLSGHIEWLSEMSAMGPAILTNIPTIGEATARSVMTYFSDNKNIKTVNALDAMLYYERRAMAVGDKFKGETCVVTGSIPGHTRQDIHRLIKSNGGKVDLSVNKDTTLVIVGEKPGSAAATAKKRELRTMNKFDFIKLIEEL